LFDWKKSRFGRFGVSRAGCSGAVADVTDDMDEGGGEGVSNWLERNVTFSYGRFFFEFTACCKCQLSLTIFNSRPRPVIAGT
jgi:hypothetical protein